MAQILSLSSGSPFIGSPITLSIKAKSINDQTGTLAYHRLRVDVYGALVGMTTGNDTAYTCQQMSTPSDDGETHTIDISSALRAVMDKYNYTSATGTYPLVRWRVEAYDEYMINGTVYEKQSISYFPGVDSTPVTEPTQDASGYHAVDGYIYYHSCNGKYDDLTRLRASADIATIQVLTTKPCSASFCSATGRATGSPQVVALGETFVYAADLSDAMSFATLASGNKSQYVTISKEGLQTIGGCSVYALPKDLSGDRYEFRFVNSRGVLESISFKSLRETEVNISSTEYVISQPETFREFSRAKVSKSQDYETWKMQTPPLDRAWHQWYIHEFLMAENVWINLNPPSPATQSPTPLWVPCLILPEDTVTGIDRNGAKALTCEFSVRLGLNGTTLV